MASSSPSGYLASRSPTAALAKPVESSGSPWTYSTTSMPFSSNSALRRLGAQAHRLERVEVDHRHRAALADLVDDRLGALLAEEAVVRRDVDEDALDDAAGVEAEHRDAGLGGIGEAVTELLRRAEGDDDGIDALGHRRRDLGVHRRVVAVRVDDGDGVAVRLGGGLEQVDRLLGRRLRRVVGRQHSDLQGLPGRSGLPAGALGDAGALTPAPTSPGRRTRRPPSVAADCRRARWRGRPARRSPCRRRR